MAEETEPTLIDPGTVSGGSEMPDQELESKKAEEAEKITPSPTKNKTSAAEEKVLTVFLKKSGYSESDVLDYDARRRVFVTSNGGKYHLLKNGTVRTVSGPYFPNYEPPSGE